MTITAFVASTRAAQNLPERVTDPTVLAQVAGALLIPENGSAGPLHKAGTTKIITNNTITTAASARSGGRLHGT